MSAGPHREDRPVSHPLIKPSVDFPRPAYSSVHAVVSGTASPELKADHLGLTGLPVLAIAATRCPRSEVWNHRRPNVPSTGFSAKLSKQ